MPQPTSQTGFILSFANMSGQEIPRHRLISMTPEATTLANVYPAENTGTAIGITVDNCDAKQGINVQRGGIAILELQANTTLTAGAPIKAGLSGLGRARGADGTIVAYAIDAITSSPAGARIRVILANA